jgi:hypothetical protein
MNMKRHHWSILIFTLLILGVLLGYSLVKNGYVPVALVNGKAMSLATVRDNASVAQTLYALEGESSLSEDELFSQALESLIVSAIINSNAHDSAQNRAEARMESYLNDSNITSLKNLAESVYGWNINTFKARILFPRALEEVLREDMTENFNSWLANAKANASVSIWFLPYEWREGRLERK